MNQHGPPHLTIIQFDVCVFICLFALEINILPKESKTCQLLGSVICPKRAGIQLSGFAEGDATKICHRLRCNSIFRERCEISESVP